MATFKYQLDNVLNLRKQLEDVKQKEYAEALECLKKEKEEKNNIEKSIEINNNVLKKCLSNTINPVEIKQQQNYQLSLKKQKKIAVKNVKMAKNKTIKQREDLLEAMKNKKTLEILKEKKHEEFIEEEKKEEQQIIDEIVSFSHNNQR